VAGPREGLSDLGLPGLGFLVKRFARVVSDGAEASDGADSSDGNVSFAP